MNTLALFKLLSDETRLLMILMIAQEGELCVCELVAALELSQPKISRHLAMLRKQGLLSDRRSGKWVYYSTANDLPSTFKDIITMSADQEQSQLQVLRERLSAMGEARPERQALCC